MSIQQNNLRLWLILTLGVLLFAACDKEEVKEYPHKEVVFHLALDKAGSYSATITVTHEGTNRDLYYGFTLPGTGHNIATEVKRYCDTCSRDRLLMNALSGRKCIVRLSRLSSEHEYTYIVFNIDSTGHPTGHNGSMTFKTTKSDLIVSENPNWTATHKGTNIYNNGYYTQVNVTVNGTAEERYFLATYTSSFYNQFDSEEDFIAYAVETFNQTENSEHDADFWLEGSEICTRSTNFYRVLDPGRYISYAIGINPDGTPTGHYAKTSQYIVTEYPQTSGYANLINSTWKLTDSLGNSFNITFRKDKVNQSLYVDGWATRSHTIKVKFYQNSNAISIPVQLVNSDAVYLVDGVRTHGELSLKGFWRENGSLYETRTISIITIGERQSSSRYSFSASFHIGQNRYPLGISYFFRTADNLYCDKPMYFPITMQKTN